MDKYVPPELEKEAFHCPHCEAYAKQNWGNARRGRKNHNKMVEGASFSNCYHCNQDAFWKDGTLIHPRKSSAPLPESDMPEDTKSDYVEARRVVNESPRAAAALLRVATEKLLNQVGAEGDGPYNMIGDLVNQGRIDSRVQQAYDSLRVYGNESVHLGTIDMDDDEETALQLFELMNFIVRRTITDEAFVDEMYESLPNSKKDGVEQRDEN